MSGIRKYRPSSSYLAYPAQVLDDSILQRLGLLWGTRPEEVPPKVIMTRADWEKLLKSVRSVSKDPVRMDSQTAAILFLGKSWRDNPLIERPASEPAPPRPKHRVFPVKKPSPFAHLFALPADEAVEKASREHKDRVASGTVDEEVSLNTYRRALLAIKRNAEKQLAPNPLPTIEGEEPPAPRAELRMKKRGEQAGL